MGQYYRHYSAEETRRVRKEGGNFKHISSRLPFGNP